MHSPHTRHLDRPVLACASNSAVPGILLSEQINRDRDRSSFKKRFVSLNRYAIIESTIGFRRQVSNEKRCAVCTQFVGQENERIESMRERIGRERIGRERIERMTRRRETHLFVDKEKWRVWQRSLEKHQRSWTTANPLNSRSSTFLPGSPTVTPHTLIFFLNSNNTHALFSGGEVVHKCIPHGASRFIIFSSFSPSLLPCCLTLQSREKKQVLCSSTSPGEQANYFSVFFIALFLVTTLALIFGAF